VNSIGLINWKELWVQEQFFLERPNLFAIIHSANGGKGEGCLVEEYTVALLC
jgi:hypothetical protein